MTYIELQKRHADEIAAFPHAFAFNQVQLDEAREKLGKNLVHIFAGLYIRISDYNAYKEMMERHNAETNEFLGQKENFIDALVYEMGNHEYIVTYDISEPLRALGVFELDKTKTEWVLEAQKRYLEAYKED